MGKSLNPHKQKHLSFMEISGDFFHKGMELKEKEIGIFELGEPKHLNSIIKKNRKETEIK